jgi:hypothetical protein
MLIIEIHLFQSLQKVTELPGAEIGKEEQLTANRSAAVFIIPDEVIHGINFRHTRDNYSAGGHAAMVIIGSIYPETAIFYKSLQMQTFLPGGSGEIPGCERVVRYGSEHIPGEETV